MTVEGSIKLDIRKLDKECFINDGWISHCKLSNGEYIELKAITDGILSLSNNQVIPLNKINCNYGGYRYRFKCPKCDKNYEILYFTNNIYLCRQCHKLPYSCQLESKIDQIIRKIRKIRERLEVSGNLSEPILLKPKNMHWKTFIQLREKEMILSQQYCQETMKYLKLDLDF